jgi:biotin transport system substrate-specific component
LHPARRKNLTLNWNPEGSPVSNPVSVATAPVAAAPAWLRTVGIALAGSALVAVCAHLALPLFFTPVPLSLAPFAVLLLGLALSPRQAATTLAAYLAEGAMGLPVFTPSALAPGGLAHLLGPTGGYLLTYPLAAGLIALLWRRSGRGLDAALGAGAAGSVTILAGGAVWLAALTHISAQAAIALAVVPFLPGDALKVAAAAALAVCFQRLRRHTA